MTAFSSLCFLFRFRLCHRVLIRFITEDKHYNHQPLLSYIHWKFCILIFNTNSTVCKNYDLSVWLMFWWYIYVFYWSYKSLGNVVILVSWEFCTREIMILWHQLTFKFLRISGSYGSTLRYKNIERVKAIGKHSLLGASGEISDFQEILRYLDELT